MWKYVNVFLRQKFSNWKHSVSWSVIVLQHPVVCIVPSDSLGPFSKSFQCPGGTNSLCTTPLLSKKNNNHGFHPGSAHACFLRTRRTFRVPFFILAFGLQVVVEYPWFISSYYFMQKFTQFRVFPSNPDKFPTVSLFAPQRSFSAPILHIFFACANVVLEFYEPHF